MNILVICQYYYPENFQINAICEQLVLDGNNVTVLTGLPNYPEGVVLKDYRHGKKRDEMINGVHVIRSFEIGRRHGPVFLALNYFSFLLSANRKVFTLKEKFDIVFVYQLSPVLMAIPGIKYSKKNKIPICLYSLDLWPESLKMYIKNENNIIFKYVKNISKRIYQSSNLVVVQSTSFIDYFKTEHEIDSRKIQYIPAFADESYLTQDFSTQDDCIDFVFMGNIGKAQNLLAILQAVQMIKNISGFKVHIVGDGSSLNELKKYVEENELSKIVLFYGRRPVSEMPVYYKLADVCLVSLKADNKTGLTLPAKVQGYMAAGKPILGMIKGSAEEVINAAQCGICVEPDNINGFAEAMKDFIVNKQNYCSFGTNGREYFKNNFRKQIFMEKFETVLGELIK